MLESGMLQRLLDVAEPWRTTDCRLDTERHLVSVRIGPEPERGWFKLREVETARELRWRHVDLLGWQCEITLALPADAAIPDAPWAGEPGLRFTRALAARLANGLRAGLNPDAVALLLDLPAEEVRRFARLAEPLAPAAARAPAPAPRSAAVAAGGDTAAGPSTLPQAPATAQTATAASAPVAAASPAAVPDASSPVWAALVGGQLDIDIQQLGLKLLLNKARASLDGNEAPAERARRAGELHAYFARNPRQLAHETLQLAQQARRFA
ncbi:hypothetical protein [Derxia lacustris]|uniref:hypothetical protein n=1 Tax=Derxia lacustris TaxID=764842 RepID=UPI00111C0AE6|nr:hypothetical protein [Derxia lacustris]